jgi:hypothetical protein
VGAELFHASGQINRHDKVNSHNFEILQKRLKTDGELYFSVLELVNVRFNVAPNMKISLR